MFASGGDQHRLICLCDLQWGFCSVRSFIVDFDLSRCFLTSRWLNFLIRKIKAKVGPSLQMFLRGLHKLSVCVLKVLHICQFLLWLSSETLPLFFFFFPLEGPQEFGVFAQHYELLFHGHLV